MEGGVVRPEGGSEEMGVAERLTEDRVEDLKGWWGVNLGTKV